MRVSPDDYAQLTPISAFWFKTYGLCKDTQNKIIQGQTPPFCHSLGDSHPNNLLSLCLINKIIIAFNLIKRKDDI